MIKRKKELVEYARRLKLASLINKAAELREWFDNGGLTDNETVNSLFTDKSAKKESSHKPPNAIKYKQIKSYIPDSVLKEDYQRDVYKRQE